MKKIGLALGGGAVLGAAHVGVLQAIDKYNLKIEYLSGTSIGALAAALLAFGRDWKEIREITNDLKWVDIIGISLSKFSLLSNERLGELVKYYIGDEKIEDSYIPLAINATDIATGEKVVLDKGSLAEAIMASTCVPGVFKPIQKDNRLLVDGGIVENVPIQTCRNLGADYVIGIDLNSKNTYERPDNIIDVIMNSFHFLIRESVKLQSEKADLNIQLDLSKFNMYDTDQVNDIIKKGFEDTEKMLKKVIH